jgi:hypothetical protein
MPAQILIRFKALDVPSATLLTLLHFLLKWFCLTLTGNNNSEFIRRLNLWLWDPPPKLSIVGACFPLINFLPDEVPHLSLGESSLHSHVLEAVEIRLPIKYSVQAGYLPPRNTRLLLPLRHSSSLGFRWRSSSFFCKHIKHLIILGGGNRSVPTIFHHDVSEPLGHCRRFLAGLR